MEGATMYFLKKLFASKEVRAAVGVLDEISCAFDGPAFDIVRKEVEDVIFGAPAHFSQRVREGTPPRKWVWSAIANIAGDLLETGQYNVGCCHGVLSPIGPGVDLLRLFDTAADELVKLGAATPEFAEKQKDAIRNNIRHA
jgi:hypothetical protein